MDPTLRSGTVIGGRYRLQGRSVHLADGALNTAVDTASGQPVLVRVVTIPGGQTLGPDFVEVHRGLEGVDHPGLVRLRSHTHMGDGRPVLIFDPARLLTLRSAADQRPLSVAEVLRIARDVLGGLSALHAAGYVHGDVSLDAILLADQGGWRARLQPNGHSGLEGARPAGLRAAPAYRPPERWEGGALDRRSDLYALALVAYELLGCPLVRPGSRHPEAQHASGERPSVGTSSQIGEAVTAALSEVLRVAARPLVSGRFESATAMAAALPLPPPGEALFGGLRVTPAPESADSIVNTSPGMQPVRGRQASSAHANVLLPSRISPGLAELPLAEGRSDRFTPPGMAALPLTGFSEPSAEDTELVSGLPAALLERRMSPPPLTPAVHEVSDSEAATVMDLWPVAAQLAAQVAAEQERPTRPDLGRAAERLTHPLGGAGRPAHPRPPDRRQARRQRTVADSARMAERSRGAAAGPPRLAWIALPIVCYLGGLLLGWAL